MSEIGYLGNTADGGFISDPPDKEEEADCQWRGVMDKELKVLVRVLCEVLKADKEFYSAWQSNIATAFYDEMTYAGYEKLEGNDLHLVANNAAKRFLDSLIRDFK